MTDFFNADKNIREHLRLFAGVQCIVYCFFDGSDYPTGGGIKTEEVFVLLKELCDTDTALLFCKLISEHHAIPPRLWLMRDPESSAHRYAGS